MTEQDGYKFTVKLKGPVPHPSIDRLKPESNLTINDRGNYELKLPPDISKAIMNESNLKPGEWDIIDGCVHVYGYDGLYSVTNIDVFLQMRNDFTEEQKESYRRIAAEQSGNLEDDDE